MKLTNPEKLILLMLSDIYEKIGLDQIDTKLIRSAIYSENTWALSWELTGVVGSDADETPQDVKDVVNYLDMWSFLEDAYSGFDTSTKGLVEHEVEPFGRHIRFPGFDGNYEGNLLSIARILIDDMDRFSRFKGRDLNSHFPAKENYAKMYNVFEPIRSQLSGVGGLSPEQVVRILKAKR